MLLHLTPSAAAQTRTEALADIATMTVEIRRRAVLRLADVGTMADAPALVGRLRDDDESIRGIAEAALWRVWGRSGDATIDALYVRGLEQMNEGRAPEAIATFTDIIRQRPAFAEGWNKRATIYFFTGDYPRSLADCDEVIKRNPDHFGALAGYGQVYLRLGEPHKALESFRRALAVNPNMEGVRANIQALERLLEAERRKAI
ncbi:MAG: tetratricopeptide repeat protein [Burkholderiales bacterium]